MLLIRKLSKSNSKFYRIRYMLALMWLVIRDKVTIHEVTNFNFPQMNDLVKDMRMNPGVLYTTRHEYSLWEEKPFLTVSIQATVKVKQVNLFNVEKGGNE